jgi:hypothetical protein
MAVYAEKIAVSDAERQNLYALAKNTLAGSNCPWADCVKVQSRATDSYLIAKTWELNAYISGLQGFIKLQDLAGKSAADSALRGRVNTELTRLINLKLNNFSKDTPYTTYNNGYEFNMVNISRNFLWMTPELADILRQNRLAAAQAALTEYNTVGPYWFVSRFDAATAESANQNLYDYPSNFQARAWVLKASREELYKWLDAPAFFVGDLFYIQNLVATIEAPSAASAPKVGIAEFRTAISSLLNIFNLNTIIAGFGK